MASLPALPTLGGLRRTHRDAAAGPDHPEPQAADAKLRLARRLRAEDAARRATSVPPPPAARR
jgi:hypothetical protein